MVGVAVGALVAARIIFLVGRVGSSVGVGPDLIGVGVSVGLIVGVGVVFSSFLGD